MLAAMFSAHSAAFVSFIVVFSWAADFDLTVLHDNDVHSRFEQYDIVGAPCSPIQQQNNQCFGGAARRAALVKKLKSQYPNLIYACGGDQFQGTVWYSKLKWAPIATVMNYIGYTAMAFGNHEFDDGLEGLVPFVRNISQNILVIGTNIDAQTTELNDYVRKVVSLRIAGQDIGLLGYTTPETVQLAKTGSVRFLDEVEALKAGVAELRQRGINKIIAMGHSGISKDRELCKSVPGLDIVVGGHTNTFLYTGPQPSTEQPEGVYPEVFRDNGPPCLVVQDYAFGKYLGFLQVTFNENGELTKWSGNPILLNSSYEEDQDLLRILQPYQQEILQYRKTHVAQSATALDGLRKSCRLKECNLGNIITDASVHYYITTMLQKPNTSLSAWNDVALSIINGGGIRDFESLAHHNISMEDIYNMMPFANTVEMIRVSGKSLLEAFEYSVKDYQVEDAHGKFLQVSGFRVRYDLSKPNGQRVVGLHVRCSNCSMPRYDALDQNKLYNVVTQSFLANGGDGYTMIRDNIVASDHSEMLDADVAVKYFQRSQPIWTGLEDRITFVTDKTSDPYAVRQGACSVTVPHRFVLIIIIGIIGILA